MAITLTKKLDKGNVVKNMAKRYKLVTHIDKALGEFDEEFEFKYEPKVGDDGWHPSGDCLPAVTSLYWHAFEFLENRDIAMEAAKAAGVVLPTARPEIGVALRKTFLVGHFWHQVCQHIVLDKLGFCDESAIERRGSHVWSWIDDSDDDRELVRIAQRSPKPFHWATGSGDIAPCTIPGHGDYIVDFKTMNSRDFTQNRVPAWCSDKYEAQINIYMKFFDVERALIVPIQKDSPHSLKEFEYVRNEPLIEAIFNKWEFVSECLDAGTPPTELDDDIFNLNGLFTGPIED